MNHRILTLAITAGLLLSPVAAMAADDCTADIRGSLMRKEEGNIDTKFVAKIEVSVRQTCAVVNFDLIVIEEESGGKQHEVRVPKRVRIRDSTPATMKLNYKLKKGRQVVSHRFEQTGCTLCE